MPRKSTSRSARHRRNADRDETGIPGIIQSIDRHAHNLANQHVHHSGVGSTSSGCSGTNATAPPTNSSSNGNLLPPARSGDRNKICLVIDLDETLVHSSFKPVPNPDMVIPVQINGNLHQVYVLKRPFVDQFLQSVKDTYECVLFTASLPVYADPVANQLDRWDVFRSRLFRNACTYYRMSYVKDLSRLGRSLHRVAILDNSPASYMLQPENAIPIGSWFDDRNDTELLDLIPFLRKLSRVEDVHKVLKSNNESSSSS